MTKSVTEFRLRSWDKDKSLEFLTKFELINPRGSGGYSVHSSREKKSKET